MTWWFEFLAARLLSLALKAAFPLAAPEQPLMGEVEIDEFWLGGTRN